MRSLVTSYTSDPSLDGKVSSERYKYAWNGASVLRITAVADDSNVLPSSRAEVVGKAPADVISDREYVEVVCDGSECKLQDAKDEWEHQYE